VEPEAPNEGERKMLEWIEVQASPIHGKGVFARRNLSEGQRIGRFEGDPVVEDGTYVLWVFDDQGEEVGIEGRNALRFLNHGDAPNAEFEDADLYITRPISPGAEILIDYGAGWTADEGLDVSGTSNPQE
jgi:uncharacterized protein